MASADNIQLTYTAEIGDLRRKLAEIPDITAAEARKAVSELNKSIRAASKTQASAVKGAAGFSRATESVAKSSSQAGQAVQSLALQLPDVASQLSAGTPPAQVFVQQGLQVVQSNMGLVTQAVKALAAALTGPLGLALAVGVAAFSELETVLYDSRQSAERLQAALDGTYQSLSPERVQAAAKAWNAFNAGVEDSRILLLQEAGELSSLDLQQQKAIENARESARVKQLEIGARQAALEVQKQELQAQIDSGRLDQAELSAAIQRVSQIRDQDLPAARASVEALNEEAAAKIELINQNYNEIRSRRDAADAARASEEAARAAAKASRESAANAAREEREERARIERFKAEDARKRQRLEAEAARRQKEIEDERKHQEQLAQEQARALEARAAEYERYGDQLVDIGSKFGAALVDQEISLQAALGEATRGGATAVLAEVGQLYLRRAAVAAAALQFPQAAAFASAAALAGVAGGVVGNVQIRRDRAGHRRRR